MRNSKGQFTKGMENPFKGKTLPWNNKAIEARKLSGMYENKKPHSGDFKKGFTPWNFKETGVGMASLHAWVKRRLGRPMKCEFCGVEVKSFYKIHWANKSHEYKRDVADWIRLCVPCHKRYDLNFIKTK